MFRNPHDNRRVDVRIGTPVERKDPSAWIRELHTQTKTRPVDRRPNDQGAAGRPIRTDSVSIQEPVRNSPQGENVRIRPVRPEDVRSRQNGRRPDQQQEPLANNRDLTASFPNPNADRTLQGYIARQPSIGGESRVISGLNANPQIRVEDRRRDGYQRNSGPASKTRYTLDEGNTRGFNAQQPRYRDQRGQANERSDEPQVVRGDIPQNRGESRRTGSNHRTTNGKGATASRRVQQPVNRDRRVEATNPRPFDWSRDWQRYSQPHYPFQSSRYYNNRGQNPLHGNPWVGHSQRYPWDSSNRRTNINARGREEPFGSQPQDFWNPRSNPDFGRDWASMMNGGRGGTGRGSGPGGGSWSWSHSWSQGSRDIHAFRNNLWASSSLFSLIRIIISFENSSCTFPACRDGAKGGGGGGGAVAPYMILPFLLAN